MKLLSRIIVFGFAVLRAPRFFRPRMSEDGLLIAHNLLLGDTLMLTPLMRSALTEFPSQPKFILCRPAFRELVSLNGMGFTPVEFDLKNPKTVISLILLLSGRIRTALIVGDNRYGWLARACGASQIIGDSDEPVTWKRVSLTGHVPFMSEPQRRWADQLAISFFPKNYLQSDPRDWPRLSEKTQEDSTPPERKRILLHLGASSKLKHWSRDYWQIILDHLKSKGAEVFISVGPGEAHLLEGLDRENYSKKIPGNSSLVDLAFLIKSLNLLISVDTGIAHIAKLTNTPSIVLYGPGNPVLYDAGDYWRKHQQVSLFNENIVCRDQSTVFKRPVHWVRKCGRGSDECRTPGLCINSVKPADVILKINEILL